MSSQNVMMGSILWGEAGCEFEEFRLPPPPPPPNPASEHVMEISSVSNSFI